MKRISRLRSLAGGMSLGVLLLVGTAGSVFAAPTQGSQGAKPPFNSASQPQAKPPVDSDSSKDAKSTASLGTTNLVKTDSDGKPQTDSVRALAGTVANVDFQKPLNYCYKNLVRTPVKNTTATTKYLRVQLYSSSTASYHDIYTSVAANGFAYPSFYGIEGDYTAYLYVWNGSSYQYDEYLTNKNVCKVSVTRVYNTGGWVQLKIQNLGTAYASQQSTELAPYPGAGTYTGTHYDYPVAGGAAIYRWFNVGTSPYAVVSSTVGSTNAPYFFTGDL